jgi:hypothetical protein
MSDIYINKDTEENKNEKFRYEVLIHELVHILVFTYSDYMEMFSKDKSSYKVLMKERLVNSLARIISEMCPLDRIRGE